MLPLDMKISNSATGTLLIHAESGSKGVQELGEDESYHLEIASSGAKLDAPTTLGVTRGLQTLLQLVQATPAGFAAPSLTMMTSPASRGVG